MIDNFEQIKNLLKFDNEYQFYFLQIIQRKKDFKEDDTITYLGTNNNNRLIKAYYIFSLEQLEKYKSEILALCNLFKARAGISLNRRDARVISLEMMKLLADNIKNNHFNQLSKIYNTVCGQYHQEKDKTWILDIDYMTGYYIKTIDEVIRQNLVKDLYNIEPIGSKIITAIPSKSGYHLITRSFNSQKFSQMYPKIEIHKNNPTDLYIP